MLNQMLKWIAVLSVLIHTTAWGNAMRSPEKKPPVRVLMVGGGASHDFERWYRQEDVRTLQEGGLAAVTYTDNPAEILSRLAQTDVLLLSNNQPIKDKATRDAIFSFVGQGKGLVLCHAAVWYNWADWPEYNKELVGGGSRGHDKYGPFDVTIVRKKHPIVRKVPVSFRLDDELYYFIADPAATPIEVLATAKGAKENTYPSVFVVKHPKGRIAGIALGHDAASHELPAYKTLLRNAVKWAAGK